MRLTDEQILDGLTHPDALVREEILQCYQQGHTNRADVMPRVIAAFERYGRDAFQHPNQMVDLPQTVETVDWLLHSLKGKSIRECSRDVYETALARTLIRSAPALLEPHLDKVLLILNREPGWAATVRRRIELARWDANRLWDELERNVRSLVQKTSRYTDVNDNITDVIEALARAPQLDAERVLQILRQEVGDDDDDPRVWMMMFTAQLAGEMRLAAAVPSLASKLRLKLEGLDEDCMIALEKIATDEAVRLVAEGWRETEWGYRLFATGVLQVRRSELALQTSLDLMSQEPHDDIRTSLAVAALYQFDDRAIEPVGQCVEAEAYAAGLLDLQQVLIAVSTLMEVRFPQYEPWKHAVEQRVAEFEDRMRKFNQSSDMPATPMRPVAPKPKPLPPPLPASRPFLGPKKTVGRNDPCPCGSRKKFKHCCLKRQ